ncbi:MRC [Mytilus coruscus]|uniref:MRC n=1 Tax=Mytilus coruscus TaxID=42192 RepID=A0A6J8BAW4_MYTCO|nr:MRC [Mytilus coruscus]
MSETDGNEIADDSTYIRSNITTWQKSLAGKCADHNCEEGKKCEFKVNNNRYKCVDAYGKGLPNTSNAGLDERFGLRQDLNTGNKYKCNSEYIMEGKPFAVCQSPGHWKVLFYCNTKLSITLAKVDACSSDGYEYELNTKTCVKLVEAPKSKWEDARETCQQQSGGDLVSITTKEKWNFIIKHLEGSIGCIKITYSSNSTVIQYVPLLNKVKTPVMAEIDLSKLGEQLKSFMKIEIEKVITERIALESAKIYNKLENNLNSAIENFTTSMEANTDGVLHNTSIPMGMDIEQKPNTLTRRVRRFRTIMHSDIRSNLQSVKREIGSILSDSYNKSNNYYPDRKTF